MKNISLIIIAIILLFGNTSCEKIALKSNPSVDNESIYDEYWKIFKEKYAMFDAKNVNWEEVKNVTRPLVNNTISQDSLFSVLASMTITLKDGHTVLIDYEKSTGAFFDLEEGYPKNLNEDLVKLYLKGDVKTQGDGLSYVTLDENIGYITYRDFEKEVTNEMMDAMLTDLKDTKGIILDVRGNGGGDPSYAALMASHFTDSEKDTGFERFKTGPGKNDFTDSPAKIRPSSGVNYTKPVMVLTNRGCYSATTTLIYSMNPLNHVKFIGGRTGGGSGSVADGYLANGWYYSLSTSEFIDNDGLHLDDGFDPDIMIDLDEDDLTKDEIIERAIEEIL